MSALFDKTEDSKSLDDTNLELNPEKYNITTQMAPGETTNRKDNTMATLNVPFSSEAHQRIRRPSLIDKNDINISRSRQIFKDYTNKRIMYFNDKKMDGDMVSEMLYKDESNKKSVCRKVLNCLKTQEEIEEMFSSGPSDFDDDITFLNKSERTEKARDLWTVALKYLKMSHRTMRLYNEIATDFVVYTDGDFTKQTDSQRLRMFGTTEGLHYKEREIYKEPPKWYIVLPTSKLSISWNLVVVFLLMYIATVLPYRIAFHEETSLGWMVWDYITDCLFIIDVCFNCIMAYEDSEGIIETRIGHIICAYAKGWMGLDILACIPFDLLFSASMGGSYGKLLRLARLPRLYKLVRIFRVFKFFKVINSNKRIKNIINVMKKYSGIIRSLKIMVYAFLMVHLMSCLWYMVSRLNDHNPDTWVARGGYQDESDYYLYLLSVYWALQTLTTVGFGDITPKTEGEYYITIFWMIFGVIFYSITVSNLTSIISSFDVAESKTQSYLNNLYEFAARVNLPEDTKLKIKRFIEANSKNSDDVEYQDELLKQLPSSLRTEVISHTHNEIIRRVLFFRDKDLAFLWKILPMLKPLKVLVDDVVFNQKEKAKEMYFIIRGRIRLYYDLNDSSSIVSQPFLKGFNQYVEGSYFADSDIRVGVHDSTARPLTEVNLLVLSKMDLRTIIERHRREMKTFLDLSVKRKDYHQQLILRSLEKDREAYRQLQLSQFEEDTDLQAPAQFVVKNLRNYLDTLKKLTTFQERVYRIISKSDVPGSDSEEGLYVSEVDSEDEFDPVNNRTFDKEAASNQNESEEGSDASDESNHNLKTLNRLVTRGIKDKQVKGKNLDVFSLMLKNNMTRMAKQMVQKKKQKDEEEKKQREELAQQNLKINKVAANVKLPPPTTNSKLAKNYDKIREICTLIKDENIALDSAINEIFKHNRFIRDKTTENEQRLKRLLNAV